MFDSIGSRQRQRPDQMILACLIWVEDIQLLKVLKPKALVHSIEAPISWVTDVKINQEFPSLHTWRQQSDWLFKHELHKAPLVNAVCPNWDADKEQSILWEDHCCVQRVGRGNGRNAIIRGSWRRTRSSLNSEYVQLSSVRCVRRSKNEEVMTSSCHS